MHVAPKSSAYQTPRDRVSLPDKMGALLLRRGSASLSQQGGRPSRRDEHARLRRAPIARSRSGEATLPPCRSARCEAPKSSVLRLRMNGSLPLEAKTQASSRRGGQSSEERWISCPERRAAVSTPRGTGCHPPTKRGAEAPRSSGNHAPLEPSHSNSEERERPCPGWYQKHTDPKNTVSRCRGTKRTMLD